MLLCGIKIVGVRAQKKKTPTKLPSRIILQSLKKDSRGVTSSLLGPLCLVVELLKALKRNKSS